MSDSLQIVILVVVLMYCLLVAMFTALDDEPSSLLDYLYLVGRNHLRVGVAVWQWLVGPARHWIADPPRKRKNDE